mgnify:CR=1 FL=1
MNLDDLTLEELETLVAEAKTLLNLHKEKLQKSMQSDFAKLARAAGLSPEEWRQLVGD